MNVASAAMMLATSGIHHPMTTDTATTAHTANLTMISQTL
jgi:hypothetical protein